jgi:hypothetical protein
MTICQYKFQIEPTLILCDFILFYFVFFPLLTIFNLSILHFFFSLIVKFAPNEKECQTKIVKKIKSKNQKIKTKVLKVKI